MTTAPGAYGEAPTQQWIDNFHTGFNLVALRRIRDFAGTAEFDAAIRKGLDFFKAHFFRDDGAPKYFHDAVYPIDIHSAAQSIITLAEFSDFGDGHTSPSPARSSDWTLGNMREPEGLFLLPETSPVHGEDAVHEMVTGLDAPGPGHPP
ncbi:MAG: hypothetical protein M0C28_27560 [Candidatus Moduliflexus flocculans]|nr:hypothetical protein [Candidatus Moduliflexus flocculans]